jgi:hypothetical protein
MDSVSAGPLVGEGTSAALGASVGTKESVELVPSDGPGASVGAGAAVGESWAEADGSGDAAGSAANAANGEITVEMKTMSVKKTSTLWVTDCRSVGDVGTNSP